MNEETKEKNNDEKLAGEIKDELKKLKPIQCQGNIFEAFRAERATALKLTHKAVRAENIPFSAASKDIWRRIKAQRRTCELPQHELKESVEEEKDGDSANKQLPEQTVEQEVDATIEEPPELPMEKDG